MSVEVACEMLGVGHHNKMVTEQLAEMFGKKCFSDAFASAKYHRDLAGCPRHLRGSGAPAKEIVKKDFIAIAYDFQHIGRKSGAISLNRLGSESLPLIINVGRQFPPRQE